MSLPLESRDRCTFFTVTYARRRYEVVLHSVAQRLVVGGNSHVIRFWLWGDLELLD